MAWWPAGTPRVPAEPPTTWLSAVNHSVKIAVHSVAPPKSNPNISRSAQTVVVFWSDSDGDLPVPVCGALLDKNKKTEAGNAPALRSNGEHHHGDDGVPSVQRVERIRLRSIISDRALYPCAGRTSRSFAGRSGSAFPVRSAQRTGSGEFAPLALQPKGRIVPHILAAVLVASAMIVLGAVFQSDLRGLLAAYAGGSVAAAPDQTPANLPAAKQTAVKDPARVSDIKLASADAQDLPLRQRRAAKRSRPPIRTRCSPRRPRPSRRSPRLLLSPPRHSLPRRSPPRHSMPTRWPG